MTWLLLAVASCKKEGVVPELRPAPAAPAAVVEPAPAAPAGCRVPEDCAQGEVCEGEGCGDDRPGSCVAAMRACTRDLRPYCGCDGETFLSSGSCPGRRYAQRGPCEGEPGAE